MKSSDVRLIDPTFGRLATEVLKAAKVANGRVRRERIEKDTLSWHRSLWRVWRKPSGWQEWPRKDSPYDAPLVRVAWWTDRLGRKHWRVRGTRRSYLELHQANWPLARHDLWHVYPDRLLWRKVGDREELLAACGCGVVGRPEAISWTGERCGPCHDRLEEEGAVAQARPFTAEWKKHRNAVVQVVFPPDGGVVTGGADGRVVRWEEEGAGRVLLNRPSGYVQELAVSPAGHVAVSPSLNRVLLLDPATEAWRTLPVSGAHYYGTALAFSPGGEWLFVAAGDWAYLLDPGQPEPALRPFVQGRQLTAGAFAADGQAVYACEATGALVRLEVPSGDVTVVRPAPAGFEVDRHPFLDEDGIGWPTLGCSPDGQWLVTSGAWDDWVGLHCCHLPSGMWSPLRGSPGLGRRSMAFPGPEELQASCYDGTVAVWSLADGALESLWCPSTRPWYGGTFLSPGGEWLIQGHHDGTVVRMPWKELLVAAG